MKLPRVLHTVRCNLMGHRIIPFFDFSFYCSADFRVVWYVFLWTIDITWLPLSSLRILSVTRLDTVSAFMSPESSHFFVLALDQISKNPLGGRTAHSLHTPRFPPVCHGPYVDTGYIYEYIRSMMYQILCASTLLNVFTHSIHFSSTSTK